MVESMNYEFMITLFSSGPVSSSLYAQNIPHEHPVTYKPPNSPYSPSLTTILHSVITIKSP